MCFQCPLSCRSSGSVSSHGPSLRIDTDSFAVLTTFVLWRHGGRLSNLSEFHHGKRRRFDVLSATNTYNYPLAKWLEEKLKPLSTNAYTISDIFQFSEDIRNISVDADHILVSYDVTALFTNVPAHETIGILAEKAFTGNWFNNTFNL